MDKWLDDPKAKAYPTLGEPLTSEYAKGLTDAELTDGAYNITRTRPPAHR